MKKGVKMRHSEHYGVVRQKNNEKIATLIF